MGYLRKWPNSNVDEGRSVDEGSMKKLMYIGSAFSQFDLNTRSPDTLLDSAASVHFFNIKERFSNFKKAPKGQSLLCGRKVISIDGWRQVLLPIKVKSWIKLLTPNNVAYILSFPLNVALLGCL